MDLWNLYFLWLDRRMKVCTTFVLEGNSGEEWRGRCNSTIEWSAISANGDPGHIYECCSTMWDLERVFSMTVASTLARSLGSTGRPSRVTSDPGVER